MISLSPPLQQVDRTKVLYKGRKLTYFGGCDYFRLSTHPEIHNALETGLRKYGLNVAASRVTTGNHRLYNEIEEALCDFFGAKAAVFLPSGYAANLAAAEALAGNVTHALIHEKSHVSLSSSVRLLGCNVNPFSRLKHLRGSSRPLILTDGLFARDGEIAPLGEYVDALPRNGLLLVDDAHGAGTLGNKGRGTPEFHGIKTDRIIQTITLSKAFGVYGGAVLCSQAIREAIVSRSNLFIGQTPLPLPLVCAALRSLQLMRSDRSLRKRLQENTQFVKAALADSFTIPGNPSPIISIVPKQIAGVKEVLLSAEIYPPFIRYPSGPRNGYFRFAISSEHSLAELSRLVEVLLQFRR